MDKNYYFAESVAADKEEIIQVVYESHLHGYTSIITGPPDRKGTEEAVNRRFTAFSETGTLHFGTIVKAVDSHKIAAVCLAGIYPGACDHFATIHQVSVLPRHRLFSRLHVSWEPNLLLFKIIGRNYSRPAGSNFCQCIETAGSEKV